MPFSTTCAHCSKSFEVDEIELQTVVFCPHCGEMSSSNSETGPSSFLITDSISPNLLHTSSGDGPSATASNNLETASPETENVIAEDTDHGYFTPPATEEKPQEPEAASTPELGLAPSEGGWLTDERMTESPQPPADAQELFGQGDLSASFAEASSDFDRTKHFGLDPADLKTKEETPFTDQESSPHSDALLHEATPAVLPPPPAETNRQEGFFAAVATSESDAFSIESEDPFAALDLAFDNLTRDMTPPPLNISSLPQSQSSGDPQPTAGLASPDGSSEFPQQPSPPSETVETQFVIPQQDISSAQSPIAHGPSSSAANQTSQSPASWLGTSQNAAVTLPWLPNHGRWEPSIPISIVPNEPAAHPDDAKDRFAHQQEPKGESTVREPIPEDENGLVLEEIPPLWMGFTRKRIASAVTAALVLGLFFGLWFGPNTGPDETTKAGRAEINFAQGNRLFQEDLPDEALVQYRSAIGDGFDRAAIFRAKGAALAQQRRFSEAAKAYEEYLARNPDAKDRIEIEESLRAFYDKDEIP